MRPKPRGGTDPAGRPIFPAVFCTDLTVNGVNSTAGDWQQGGTGIGPDFVSGTWKRAIKSIDQTKSPTAVTLTTDSDPAKNHWVLGPGADTPTGGFAGLTDEGYGAEARWNVDTLLCQGVALQSGHTYRIQFMVHDGDQNKSGGDVGQACATVALP